jgi:DNA-binding GntR family transcriptional regulator
VSRKIISDSERLFHQLSLDPESRREFEAAREAHAARVAGLAAGDAAEYVEACLDYLSELGRIATRSRDRHRRRGDAPQRGG